MQTSEWRQLLGSLRKGLSSSAEVEAAQHVRRRVVMKVIGSSVGSIASKATCRTLGFTLSGKGNHWRVLCREVTCSDLF